MKIEKAIQQDRFKSEYQKAHINILYTAAWLSQRTSQSLKPFNISWQQFNILRILRGMQPEPATIKLLTERMIDKMSNASRLVDKLQKKGFVERKACENDRRRIHIFLTEAGSQLLQEASEVVEQNIPSAMATIGEDGARQLNELLDTIRTYSSDKQAAE